MRYTEIVPHPKPDALSLVVRMVPALYSRIPVEIRDGPAFAEIDIRSARVTFPRPLVDDGTISMECLIWLVDAVANASTTLRYPMCLVLDEDQAVYFKPDGEAHYSRNPPRDGVPLNLMTVDPDEPLPASVTICPLVAE